jgi:hypothetical protein
LATRAIQFQANSALGNPTSSTVLARKINSWIRFSLGGFPSDLAWSPFAADRRSLHTLRLPISRRFGARSNDGFRRTLGRSDRQENCRPKPQFSLRLAQGGVPRIDTLYRSARRSYYSPDPPNPRSARFTPLSTGREWGRGTGPFRRP